MTIARNLAAFVKLRAAESPVVAITGPRQSGKTTLCRACFPEKPYVSLEALDTRDYAASDPRGFLAQYRSGAILDEIQRVPSLLSYLQGEVDERPVPGRFGQTGSEHLGLSVAVSQSLAGRIALLHLLPPSLDELGRFGPLPRDVWTLLWTGGYPRIWDRGLDPAAWLADYAATYVQRDVRQVLNVTSLESFSTFLQLAAGRTSAEVNLSSLGGDAGITHPTARAWLSVLEASFIVHRLPAWHRNLRKRVVRSPKLHFLDTGLACHLLGITEPDQLRRHPLRGALFESWVASEVLKNRVHRGLPPRMFHYREIRRREIDLVVEEGSRLLLAEAKSTATVARDFFAPLQELAEELSGQRPDLAVAPRIVFGGDEGQRRQGIEVVPWGRLHDLEW
jgi:predicted AAA+ superfamily ATPase